MAQVQTHSLPAAPSTEDQLSFYASEHASADGYRLHSADGATVDVYRTRSGARHAALLLNIGACRVDPFGALRSRVIPAADAEARERSRIEGGTREQWEWRPLPRACQHGAASPSACVRCRIGSAS